MNSVCLIGYGNPLRQDDAAGWEAARRLEEKYGHTPGVEILALHQLTPELADTLSHSSLAVFIDAARDGEGKPGEVRVRRIASPSERNRAGEGLGQAETAAPGASAPGNAPGIFAHHLTPWTLLEYAKAWFDRAPGAVVVSIYGERFGFGEGLSERAEQGLRRALEDIGRLLNSRMDAISQQDCPNA